VSIRDQNGSRRRVGIGSVLCDRYRLEEALARGGCAVVYRATDLVLSETVAIKVLLRPGSRAEAVSALRLSHPLILRVYHYEQHGPFEFLVMELVVGETLTQRLRRQPARRLPVLETVQIGIDCLEALAYAHDVGVVHNDIKPGNLLMTEAGALKVCDFGLARLLAEPAPRSLAGTPGFMSPEARRGEPSTPRTDLFSLAATLYALGNGRLMMDKTLAGGALYEGPPPSLHLPPVVHELIHIAAAPDPRDRYGSAAEMRGALVKVKCALDGTSGDQPFQPMPPAHTDSLAIEFDSPPPTRREKQILPELHSDEYN
jgi:eukaryotic-like serine/threonine-protein kinase